MTIDTAHTLIGTVAILLAVVGAWMAWGPGYGLMLCGGILLAGVIYARTR